MAGGRWPGGAPLPRCPAAPSRGPTSGWRPSPGSPGPTSLDARATRRAWGAWGVGVGPGGSGLGFQGFGGRGGGDWRCSWCSLLSWECVWCFFSQVACKLDSWPLFAQGGGLPQVVCSGCSMFMCRFCWVTKLDTLPSVAFWLLEQNIPKGVPSPPPGRPPPRVL